MRPASSNTTLSTARSEAALTVGGARVPLVVVRSARARRLRLAVVPGGGLRLTLPRRAALAPALAWAEGQGTWIEAALARVVPAVALAPGSSLPFDGQTLTVRWDEAAGRRVRVVGDALVVGGPAELVSTRLLRWLKAEARARLEAETRATAVRAGVSIGRVRVGDARTRWGSCSSGGDVAYNWRLVLAPVEVRLATVAHEVAHRLHMDHSPAFHAAVARILGHEPKAERAWLRTNGAALHAIGRDG